MLNWTTEAPRPITPTRRAAHPEADARHLAECRLQNHLAATYVHDLDGREYFGRMRRDEGIAWSPSLKQLKRGDFQT